MKRNYGVIGILALLTGCASEQKAVPETGEEIYLIENEVVVSQGVSEGITPEVYAIAATRAANKMLDETGEIYEDLNKPKLYIMQPRRVDKTLPDGIFYARKVVREIIEGSRNYTVVDNLNDADYFLEVDIDRGGNGQTPTIIYGMALFDKNNVMIGEWSETLKKVRNDDQSWW